MFEDLTGKVYGSLVVKERVSNSKAGEKCRCEAELKYYGYNRP